MKFRLFVFLATSVSFAHEVPEDFWTSGILQSDGEFSESDLGMEDVPSKVIEQKSSHQGDKRLAGFTPPGVAWPKSATSDFYEIPYSIDDSYKKTTFPAVLEWVMQYIESETLIRFVKRSTEERYVFFSNSQGCASSVGRPDLDVKVAVVHLKYPNCRRVGTVLHELCHTLGMLHEHQRPDRDSYVTINRENMKENFDLQFLKFSPEFQEKTDYDYASIMHYGNREGSKNGGAVLSPVDPAYKTMFEYSRALLSSCDWATLKRLYPDESKPIKCIPNVIGRGLQPTENCLKKFNYDHCELACTYHANNALRAGYCEPAGGLMFPPSPSQYQHLPSNIDADPDRIKKKMLEHVFPNSNKTISSLISIVIVISSLVLC